MKSLIHYIQEKLIIKKSKTIGHKYFPKTKDELKAIIKKRIKEEGNEVDLNDIDTSNITDMSELFERTDFNGNISKWNVSNVKNMSYMFWDCKKFNQDISSWNVSNITDMSYMFYKCTNFNHPISAWDVSNVTNMNGMFYECISFNRDISNWNVSNVNSMFYTFDHCYLKEKYKPKFK